MGRQFEEKKGRGSSAATTNARRIFFCLGCSREIEKMRAGGRRGPAAGVRPTVKVPAQAFLKTGTRRGRIEKNAATAPARLKPRLD